MVTISGLTGPSTCVGSVGQSSAKSEMYLSLGRCTVRGGVGEEFASTPRAAKWLLTPFSTQRRWTSLIPMSTTDAMQSDVPIRMSAFLGVLTLMALWEVVAPRRSFSVPRGPRWFANITVVVLDSVIV